MPADSKSASATTLPAHPEGQAPWREQVLAGVVKTLLVTGVINLFVVDGELLARGLRALVFLQWGMVATLVGILLLRRRLGFSIRLGALLILLEVAALASVLGERRIADFALFLTAGALLAMLLGGLRWGLASLAVAALTIVGVGYVHVRGAIGPPPDIIDPQRSDAWFSLFTDWALCTVPLSVSLWFVIRRIESALAQSRALGEDLQVEMRKREEASIARRAMEEQLLHSQKLEVVGQLAGGIAHDFNNLLTVIILGTEAADDPDLPPSHRLALAGVREAAEHAASLTQQLLAFGRRAIVAPKPYDLAALVRASMRMVTRLIPEAVGVEQDLAPEAMVTVIDEVQFHQVLFNLVVNACDAMPAGGALRVRARRNDGRVVLEVEDDGVGMDEATRARVFEPFFTTKATGAGTGLGMATVASIVAECGGRIDVRSAVGAGTTVTVSLPRHEGPAQEPTSRSARAAARSSGRILVADDDIRVRASLVSTLESAGYEVAEAPNGAAALAVLEGSPRPFCLLITDVVMPGMSGPELVGHAKVHQPELAVLFCSGYAPDEGLRRAIAAGSVSLLQKPFSRAELLEEVARALEAGVAPLV